MDKYVGIDVHARSCTLAVVDAASGLVSTISRPTAKV